MHNPNQLQTSDVQDACLCLQAGHLVHMPPEHDLECAMLTEAVWDNAAASPFIIVACKVAEAESQAIDQEVADDIDWDKVELFNQFLAGSSAQVSFASHVRSVTHVMYRPLTRALQLTSFSMQWLKGKCYYCGECTGCSCRQAAKALNQMWAQSKM